MPDHTSGLVFAGRFTCPACPDRFHTLADKKAHIRADHRPQHDPDQED